MIKTIPGIKNVEEPKGLTKFVGNVAKDLLDKFGGINIENYLNSLSIEDIKRSNKEGIKKIICFDDLERKSDSIQMKELLGLIERATISFDVIIIANTKELTENDFDLFTKYKEKVVDYHIKLDKLNNDLLKIILKDEDTFDKDELINIYFENMMGFGSSSDKYLKENLMNLRIFKKYIDLILRATVEIGSENVDQELFRMCKAVVYDYYFPKTIKKERSMSFDKFNLYNDLNKLFLFENNSQNPFKLYKTEFTNIQKDIKALNKLYSLTESELISVLEKIDTRINENETDYFIDQFSIISLASSLEDNDLLDTNRYESLLKIALVIYLPKEHSRYTAINYRQWNSWDESGFEVECNNKIKSFIEKINTYCINKFNIFMEKKVDESKRTKDYNQLLNLYTYNELDEILDFEEIFDYYFKQLQKSYSLDKKKED